MSIGRVSNWAVPLRKKFLRQYPAVGGDNGEFGYETLWQIRGFIDKIIGGYGLSRGRRDPKHLRVGDSVDFWKVVDVRENERLFIVCSDETLGKAA